MSDLREWLRDNVRSTYYPQPDVPARSWGRTYAWCVLLAVLFVTLVALATH